MNIKIHVVGVMDAPASAGWPATWPPPREGETVLDLPGADRRPLPPLWVRSVSWYPYGSADSDGDPDPFVYVVLGPR